MNPFIIRAQLFLQHNRYTEAETELRQAIAENPDDGYAHAMLAIVLAEQGKNKDALSEAQLGTGLSPDIVYTHYSLAHVELSLERPKPALEAIAQAIRINPEEEDFYAIKASAHLKLGKWQDALNAADEGLRIAPENVPCTNLRGIALVQLGRRDEAGVTIGEALAADPENPTSHANQGWALLHRGEYDAAIAHFREALRLDPENQWARSGIVEALKGKNPIYSIMLRYMLWMGRLSGQTRWIIVLGGYFGYRYLSNLRFTAPSLAPYITPFLYAYIVFAFLTWTAGPLFDLLLRLNPDGRLVLSEKKIQASNLVGISILSGLILGAAGFLLRDWVQHPRLYTVALESFALIIPIATLFRARKNRSKVIIGIMTAALVLLTAGELGLALIGNLTMTLSDLFWIGWFVFTWIANFTLAAD